MTRHAHDHVPIHRERLAPLFANGDFDAERWAEVPILHRAEMQAQPELFRAKDIPEELGGHTDGFTSGTTGTPLRFVQSSLAVTASICLGERTLEAHGLDRGAHRASIRGRHDTPAPLSRGI